MTACLSCTHWNLSRSPMRLYGMGLCSKEEGIFRQARTFSPTAPCSKKAFEQAAPATITARERVLKRTP